MSRLTNKSKAAGNGANLKKKKKRLRNRQQGTGSQIEWWMNRWTP